MNRWQSCPVCLWHHRPTLRRLASDHAAVKSRDIRRNGCRITASGSRHPGRRAKQRTDSIDRARDSERDRRIQAGAENQTTGRRTGQKTATPPEPEQHRRAITGIDGRARITERAETPFHQLAPLGAAIADLGGHWHPMVAAPVTHELS